MAVVLPPPPASAPPSSPPLVINGIVADSPVRLLSELAKARGVLPSELLSQPSFTDKTPS